MLSYKGKDRVRILIPTVDYPPIEGGISTVATEVARELASLGHEVTVVAPRFPGMDSFDATEPAHVIRFFGYGLGWARIAPFSACARPLVRGSDLVLAINVAYGGLFARWAHARYGVPYIAFGYAYEFLKFRGVPLASRVLRGVYAHARATIAISRFTAGNLVLLGVPSDSVHVVLPGAPPARETSGALLAETRTKYKLGDGPVILSVGRLIARKGQDCLIGAFRRVLDVFPGARLVIAGRGPTLERCRALAHGLGVDTSCAFAGYVSETELAALYRLCDVFALPTGEAGRGQVEGFGLVFAEAGAYGKPVVGGRSGGVEDAVMDGETGLLVPPGDEAALSEALLRLLREPAYAQRLGEAGRRRVETALNWRTFTRSMLDVAGFGA